MPLKHLDLVWTPAASVLVVTWRRLERHAPRHASWNQTLGDGELFPYLALEHQPQLLASLLRQQQGHEVKLRDLNIRDILKLSPNATRKKRRSRIFDEEYEDDSAVWPLAPLDGCPKVKYRQSHSSSSCIIDNRQLSQFVPVPSSCSGNTTNEFP